MYSHCVEEAREVRYRDADLPSELEECAYFAWYAKEYDAVQSYTVIIEKTVESASPKQRRFEQLAHAWKLATKFTSSLSKIVQNDDYQQVISMGISAVPFILRDLADTHAYWFPALEQITSENPVSQAAQGDVRAMAHSWLSWGREKGLI